MSKAIFLTTLSNLPKHLEQSTATYKENGKGVCVNYFLQQRPGFEFSHTILTSNGKKEKFDKIFVLCSNEISNATIHDQELKKKLDLKEAMSLFAVYKYRIINNLENDSDIAISGYEHTSCIRKANYFDEDFNSIPLTNDIMMDVNRIISEIVKFGNDDEVDLYIDTQGGKRTTNLVVQAVLFIANISSVKINIVEILAGEPVANEKNKYRYSSVKKDYEIFNLVSGMTSFLKYGKADIIDDYITNTEYKRSDLHHDLVDQMKAVDKSLSCCNVSELKSSLKKLWRVLKSNDYENDKLAFFIEEIKKDYRDIFDANDEIDIVRLIKWALNNKFYQQALTLAEAEFPSTVFENINFKIDDVDNKWLLDTCLHLKNGCRDCNFSNACFKYKECTKKAQINSFMLARICHYYSLDSDEKMNDEFKFSLSYNGKTCFLKGDNIKTNKVEGSQELKDFSKNFVAIKRIRNSINHAETKMEGTIKDAIRYKSFNNVEDAIEYIINEMLKNYELVKKARK